MDKKDKKKDLKILTIDEARYIIVKLDTPSNIPIKGHQDRMLMNSVCNKLIEIINNE